MNDARAVYAIESFHDTQAIDETEISPPLATPYVQYLIRSPHQRYETAVKILRPEGLPADQIKRVIYILPAAPQITHRWGDGLDTFLQLGLHNQYGVAAVTPYFADWPWMADHPTDPRIQQVRYLLEDVLPLVDGLFPDAARLLLGLSKSGTAAFQLLLRHPDLFEAIAVFDSPIMKMSPDQWEMPDFWVSDQHYRPYAIPLLLRERASELRQRARIGLFGYGVFGKNPPDWTIDHLTAGHKLMNDLGIPHIYNNSTWYAHHWASGWMEMAVAALDEMTATK